MNNFDELDDGSQLDGLELEIGREEEEQLLGTEFDNPSRTHHDDAVEINNTERFSDCEGSENDSHDQDLPSNSPLSGVAKVMELARQAMATSSPVTSASGQKRLTSDESEGKGRGKNKACRKMKLERMVGAERGIKRTAKPMILNPTSVPNSKVFESFRRNLKPSPFGRLGPQPGNNKNRTRKSPFFDFYSRPLPPKMLNLEGIPKLAIGHQHFRRNQDISHEVAKTNDLRNKLSKKRKQRPKMMRGDFRRQKNKKACRQSNDLMDEKDAAVLEGNAPNPEVNGICWSPDNGSITGNMRGNQGPLCQDIRNSKPQDVVDEVMLLDHDDDAVPIQVHTTGKTLEEIHHSFALDVMEELKEKRGPVPPNAMRGNVLTNPRFKNFKISKTDLDPKKPKRPRIDQIKGRVKVVLENISDDLDNESLKHIASLHAGGENYILDFELSQEARRAIIIFVNEKAAKSMAEAMSQYIGEDNRQIKAYQPVEM